MNKKLFVVLAAMTLVIAMVGGAYATTTTQSVGVSANVTAGCIFGGVPALAFNQIDEFTNAGGAIATVVPPTLYCTTGYVATVGDDDGLNESGVNANRLTDGTNFIPYTLTYTSSITGAGAATDIGGSGAGNLNLGASIAAGALAGKPAGNYTDTVVLTITF